MNEAKKDFNKTGQIQELGSPEFKPSEINFGAITNQVGLPSNQPTTYGTIGLGSAIYGVGRNVVRRFTGRQTGDIFSPLDATVVPKAGKGVYNINGTLLDISHLTGFQKKAYANFGLNETTYGNVYKSNPDILGISGSRRSPLRDVVDIGAFSNSTYSINRRCSLK